MMFMGVLFLILALLAFLSLLIESKYKSKSRLLPPGPSVVAFFLEHVILRRKSIFQLEQVFFDLHSRYGPVFSLRTLPTPTIFIQHRLLAHRALLLHGPALSDRPALAEPMLTLSCHRHDINTSPYGPLWRRLRRNLTTQIVHPSRLKLFSPHRHRALRTLLNSCINENKTTTILSARETFRPVIFSLMISLCFGVELDDTQVREIQTIQYSLLAVFFHFNPFAVLPAVTKILFRNRWNQIMGLRRRQAQIFLSLIQSQQKQSQRSFCYAESLTSLELSEEEAGAEGGRKLMDGEIVNLCHEFLSAATYTTLTALEWIMAELVKCADVQKKLVEEIVEIIPDDEQGLLEDEDLNRLPYLKAVIMEGLRRHPPGHFVLPHNAAQDVDLDGFLIPRGADVHINIAQLGWDETVWEEPMEFRPERFMVNGEFDKEMVDITGSREIKMIPFGAGRRMCPGYGMGMLHLEFFVANLVREFEWEAVDDVDLAEDFEITTVMKNSLRARIVRRRHPLGE